MPSRVSVWASHKNHLKPTQVQCIYNKEQTKSFTPDSTYKISNITMISNTSIAFFGATGGCAAACLAHCLEAGYTCTALVRTPSKLLSLLATHNIPPSTIASHLTITTGDVKNPTDVTRTILPTTTIIISGIGSSPTWKLPSLYPTIRDPTVCADGMQTILSVLRARNPATSQPPFVIALSTTGISKYGRDMPWLMVPLYHWLLRVPHQDKQRMEDLLIAAAERGDGGVGEYAVVRSSLLTDGGETGRVRSAVEEGRVASGAVGYKISRWDVGAFVFGELVEKYEGPSGKGRIFSITT